MERKEGFRILWLIREIEISIKKYGDKGICGREGDLIFSQRLILEYLAAHEEKKICASDIRAALCIPKASLSDNLRALCKKGYLRMETSGEDERRKWIVPTGKVNEMKERMGESLEEVQARICRGISDADQETLERALGKMLENLREENVRRMDV